MAKFVYSFLARLGGNGAHGNVGRYGFQGCKKQVQQVLGLIDHGRAVGKPIFHADEVKTTIRKIQTAMQAENRRAFLSRM